MKYINFLLIFFSIVFLSGCLNKMAEKAEKKSQYSGIITNIYVDISNHSTNAFSVNSNLGKIEVGAELYPYCWKYASIGDSIIKPKGELYIIIKKKGAEPKLFYYE